jgi:hypothetical protein
MYVGVSCPDGTVIADKSSRIVHIVTISAVERYFLTCARKVHVIW